MDLERAEDPRVALNGDVGVLFVVGCASNQVKFYDPFDLISS